MKPRSPLALTAFAVSVLALCLAVGGGSYALAKVGKNQVVTKSIKNGAVTGPKLRAAAVDGSKVRDGSLTAADLAKGTIPGGQSVETASLGQAPSAPNANSAFAPSGPSGAGAGQSYVGIAPVEMRVADLHVLTPQQGIGQAVQLNLEIAPGLGNSSVVLSCTVQAQTSSCESAQQGTIPKGTPFFIRTINGPGGAAGGFVSASYTVTVP